MTNGLFMDDLHSLDAGARDEFAASACFAACFLEASPGGPRPGRALSAKRRCHDVPEAACRLAKASTRTNCGLPRVDVVDAIFEVPGSLLRNGNFDLRVGVLGQGVQASGFLTKSFNTQAGAPPSQV